MSVAIAAAGTGGHVYPALAVGEALVDLGVDRTDVHFVGGDRLEATVVPAAGFPFVAVQVRGLERRPTLRNLGVPRLIWRARRTISELFERNRVAAALGFGNYVTVPFGWAAAGLDIPFFVHEQNAHAGLGNRLAARWARAAFVSFPDTVGLRRQELTGNPVRKAFVDFERAALRPEAMRRYDLDPEVPTLGVFGGSLGAGAINEAVARLAASWGSGPLQILHLVGSRNLAELTDQAAGAPLLWRVVGFEERMEFFFAASDVVIGRAGGGVAEITATATPAILVPGGFGSGGHQPANAAALQRAGAALVVPQDELDGLADVVADVIGDPVRRKAMAEAARAYALPHAAGRIARRLLEVAGG